MNVDQERPAAGISEGVYVDPLDVITGPYNAINWVADEVFRLIADLFDRFGPPIVFVAALAEATVGVGVVFPGVLFIFLAGAYAAEDDTSIMLIFVLATAGTAIGDTVSYWLGRWGGGRLENSRLGPTMRTGRALILGRGRWLIPFYHLNSWTRAVGPFGAGALRLPLRVWMPLDYAGAVIASAAWVGAGAIFGRALLTDDGTLNDHPALRIGLGVAAMAWVWFVHREFQKAKRRESEAQANDHSADESDERSDPPAA